MNPTTHPDDGGTPVLAQMIHQSHLATWLVRTIGIALTWLTLPALVGGMVGAVMGDPVWLPVGSFFGVVAVLVYLTSVMAPLPTPEVIDLLDGDDDYSE